MRELDTAKVYYLGDLNDLQKEELLSYLKNNFKLWESTHSIYEGCLGFEHDSWYQGELTEFGALDSVNALELFQPNLKIGDTFEYNGFICRVESGVEKWVYDKYQEAYYKTIQCNSNYKEITDKEFIKQLEDNAR